MNIANSVESHTRWRCSRYCSLVIGGTWSHHSDSRDESSAVKSAGRGWPSKMSEENQSDCQNDESPHNHIGKNKPVSQTAMGSGDRR